MKLTVLNKMEVADMITWCGCSMIIEHSLLNSHDTKPFSNHSDLIGFTISAEW